MNRRRPTPHGVPARDHDALVADYQVAGHLLRFFWDYGANVPIWDKQGLLPQDDAWLQSGLGLSHSLITALRDWGHEMEARDGATSASLRRRGEDLTWWLRDELAGRYEVEYIPLTRS